MNYFVMVYDRPLQHAEVKEFAPTELGAADVYRLEQQRDALRAGADRDIILFHAESRQALEQTHGSYFFSIRELIDQFREAAQAS